MNTSQLDDDAEDIRILKNLFLKGNMDRFKSYYFGLDTSIREKASKALALEIGIEAAEDALGIEFSPTGIENINQSK